MMQMRIDICSDADYDELIAEIYCDGEFVALISQDSGDLLLEFPLAVGSENQSFRAIDLQWFETALIKAKEKLKGGQSRP